MDVDDWPRCFLHLHTDFNWFLPIGVQKEVVLARTQKRPGFAQAVNGTKVDSTVTLETHSPVWWVYFMEFIRAGDVFFFQFHMLLLEQNGQLTQQFDIVWHNLSWFRAPLGLVTFSFFVNGLKKRHWGLFKMLHATGEHTQRSIFFPWKNFVALIHLLLLMGISRPKLMSFLSECLSGLYFAVKWAKLMPIHVQLTSVVSSTSLSFTSILVRISCVASSLLNWNLTFWVNLCV